MPTATTTPLGVAILDLRAHQPNPPPPVRGKVKHKIVGGQVVERDPTQITGITIHQTACVFGPKGDHVKRHRRALGVACHALAFGSDRLVVVANPLPWYVWHGNGWNSTELGLEIEGHFPGLEDDPRTTPKREDFTTIWGGKTPTQITTDIVDTAREGLRLLVELGRQENMPIELIHAHRQSSPTRRSDPGQGLWKAVVLEYAVPVQKLRTEPKRKVGKGRPVPLSWDPDGSGRF